VIEVTETIEIAAPVPDVWAYMDDPHNQPAVSPSISEVRDIEQRADGKSLAFTYRMAGVPLDGRLATTTYEPRERIVFEMSGTLSGEIAWTFETIDRGTRFTYGAAYNVPGPLEAVARPLVVRYNERELRRTLENLRGVFESTSETTE
jgi:carbon monoxide dehydrogenase subunit G